MFGESRTERYYCRNQSGRDLFFVELIFEADYDYIYFHTSLCYNLRDIPEVMSLIKSITKTDITDGKRSELIDNIFSAIQLLPHIKKYYFSEDEVSKNGRHLPNYSTIVEELIRTKDFPDFTAFSENINAAYFEYSLPFLEEKLREKEAKIIDTNEFKILLKNNLTLANEYVELLADNSEFYWVVLSGEKNKYDCFLMMVDDVIKLFFVRQMI